MSTQTFTEAEYRIWSDDDHRALVCGNGSLVVAVANELAHRGISTAIEDDGSFDTDSIKQRFGQAGANLSVLPVTDDAVDLIDHASQAIGGLTAVINLHLPDPRHSSRSIMAYPDALLARNLAAADAMARSGGGAIVNHAALPVMYAGSELEDFVSSLRGAVTGIVRSIARKYGRQNVRSAGMQTGLIDIPEVHQWASEQVKAVDVPVKRWGSAEECAKLATFLALDASYITGQILILDGGLTAGLSGT